MKINFNKQYTMIAIHALLVILCVILCVFTFTHFGEVWSKVIDFFNIFMPIFYGMAIAYLIYPIVKFFERKVFRRLNEKKRYGLARVLSIIIVFLSVIVFIALFCWLVLPHIIEGYIDLQQMSNMYIMSLQEWLFDVAESTGELSGYMTKLIEYFIGLMESLYEYVIDRLPDVSSMAPTLINFVTNFFLGIVLSIYFLLAKERLHAQMKKFMRAFLNTKKYRVFSQSARLADKNFGGYIKGQIADSVVMGVISYFCLMAIGVPYFPLISTIIGVASLIPVIGSLLGTIIGALIIFLTNPPAVIWFTIFMIILCLINVKMIRPYMIRVGVDASTMFMFAAIIIMTGLIGFWGLVIGVPVFVILYTVLHFEVDKRLQRKGLPVDQSDYYETDAGKELFREREYKRIRRARTVKNETVEEEKEDFVVTKTEIPVFNEASPEDENKTEEPVSE
jgi:predicted PurR-regulated permease PerM